MMMMIASYGVQTLHSVVSMLSYQVGTPPPKPNVAARECECEQSTRTRTTNVQQQRVEANHVVAMWGRARLGKAGKYSNFVQNG